MNHDLIIEFISNNWLSILFGIITIISLIYAFYTHIESEKSVSEMQIKLDGANTEIQTLQTQLATVNDDINEVSEANKNEILLALFEVKNINLTGEARENFFQSNFGLTYSQANQILEYSSLTDDYSLGMSNLLHNDYMSSIVHFDLALIKDPDLNEAKIGKAGAFIGLNKTTDARDILNKLSDSYQNDFFVLKLLGDSYHSEKLYDEATNYYIEAVGEVFAKSGPKDIRVLEVATTIFELKDAGLIDNPHVSVKTLPDGWKIGSIILEKQELVCEFKYKIS